MLSVEEALALVSQHCEPLEARAVPLAGAAGLILAQDVTSDINSPPHDKAMMDGYAVMSSDRQPLREVIEEIAAGAVPRCRVTPGRAARIMTGAPLPPGADAVVPIEATEPAGDARVRLSDAKVRAGQHVLPLGAAMRAGERVLAQGGVLRPIEIGILAETGQATVLVQPRPRVAVLPTGNELVSVDRQPSAGQIRDSNGPLLRAAVERAEAEALELEIGRDDVEHLRRLVEQGLAADLLVLSGGVSAGKFDLVPHVLAELGVEQVFHKVALRPGKPLWFGLWQKGGRRVPVFGLPGNPVSSFVCFELFVRPMIAAIAGRGFVGLPTIAARLAHPFDHSGGRAACLPARWKRAHDPPADGGSDATRSRLPGLATAPAPWSVEILPWQGSSDLATLARANGLVRLPAGKRPLEAGETLEVLLV